MDQKIIDLENGLKDLEQKTFQELDLLITNLSGYLAYREEELKMELVEIINCMGTTCD